jgi:hypothetical protein
MRRLKCDWKQVSMSEDHRGAMIDNQRFRTFDWCISSANYRSSLYENFIHSTLTRLQIRVLKMKRVIS